MDLIKQINDICNQSEQEIAEWVEYFAKQAELLSEEALANDAEILNENSVGILFDRIEMALPKLHMKPALMRNIAAVLVSLIKVKKSRMKGPKVADFLDSASNTDSSMDKAAKMTMDLANTSPNDVDEFIEHIKDEKLNLKNVLKELRAYFVSGDPYKVAR